jgi:hypothetical protein
MAELSFASLVACAGCGNVVAPTSDGALDAHEVSIDGASADAFADSSRTDSRDSGLPLDADDAGARDASADARPDAAERVPPFSVITVFESSSTRSSDVERVEAYAVQPHDGGLYSRVRSGACFVENHVQPAYRPFADSIEIRATGLVARTTLGRGSIHTWRATSDVFSAEQEFWLDAASASWPTRWLVQGRFPTSVRVVQPDGDFWSMRRGGTIAIRWVSTGAPANAIVRVEFEQAIFRPALNSFDVSVIQCEYPPWIEAASLTPSAHPEFRASFGVNDGALLRIDTVLRQEGRLPNGEPVVFDARASSFTAPIRFDD